MAVRDRPVRRRLEAVPLPGVRGYKVPTYVYAHCGNTWQRKRPIHDRTTTCAVCGADVSPTIQPVMLAKSRRTEGKP